MSVNHSPMKLCHPLASRVNALPVPIYETNNPQISQSVIDAAIKALDEGKTHYTDRPGILPLRQWVCDHLKEHLNVEITPDQITMTCGHTEARFVTIKVLAQPGTTIYCPGDSGAISGMAHLAGAHVVDSPAHPDKIRLAYLTSYDSGDTLNTVMELCQQHNWWLVWDMIEGREEDLLAQNTTIKEKLVILGSLSHHIPGWRIGWMAGSEMADKLRAYKQSMTICSTSVSQWAALGLVETL